MHRPVALRNGSENASKASLASACAHQNGPPATTPTPLITEDQAVPNCTAMNPPEEMPDIELWLMSAL